jgi:exonuclease III
MRVITWNVARRSSRLAEQAAALASREPDVVALQEVTKSTLPLWRGLLERIGLPHVRASRASAHVVRQWVIACSVANSRFGAWSVAGGAV